MQKNKIENDVFSVKNFLFAEDNGYYMNRIKNVKTVSKEQQIEIERKAYEIFKKYDKEFNSKTIKYSEDESWIKQNYEKVNRWIFIEQKENYIKNINMLTNKSKEFKDYSLNDFTENLCKKVALNEIKEIEEFVNKEFESNTDSFDINKQAKLYNFYSNKIEDIYESFYTCMKFVIEARLTKSLKNEDAEEFKKNVLNAQNEVKAINIVVFAILGYSAFITANTLNMYDE